jgi:hypothetical protein
LTAETPRVHPRLTVLLKTNSRACAPCTGLENRSTLTGTQGSNSVSPLPIVAQIAACIPETPSSLGVSLRLWAQLLSGHVTRFGVCWSANCDNTRQAEWHQYGYLGTTDGTFFRRFLAEVRAAAGWETSAPGGVTHSGRTVTRPLNYATRSYRRSANPNSLTAALVFCSQ